MSENGSNLAVLCGIVGVPAFEKVVSALRGERIWFPHRIHGANHDAVLKLKRGGYSCRQIAEHLRMPVRTVQYVVARKSG